MSAKSHNIIKSLSLGQSTFGLNKASNNLIYITLASLAALAVTTLAISFVNSTALPTFAEEVSTDIATAGAYYLNLTASDTVSLSIDSPSVDSAIASVSDTVTVKTNSGSGYQLYLSMVTGSASNALTYNTTVNGTPQTYTLPATTNTTPDPSTGSITLSNDSWGYSTDNTTWKAVPLSTATQTVSDAVKTTDAANETGDETTIYYGAKITSATVPGTYTGTVMYTALGDAATASTATIATISPSTVEYNTTPSNNRISITTPLFTNMEIAASRVNATIGTSSCTDIALSSPDGQLVVSCTIPELADGTYTATVNIADFNKTYSGEITYQTTLNSITPEITAVSPTDLSTQTTFTVDTNLNYAKYNSILTNVGTGTIKVNNVDCAGVVTTTSNTSNNDNIRFTCPTSPVNPATTGDTKYITTLTLTDTSGNTKTATTANNLFTMGVTYPVTDSGVELTISPNEAKTDETPTVTITTGLTAKTGIDPGVVTATIGGSDCTNPSIVESSNPLQITCTAPLIAETGAKDVAVAISGHNYSKATTGIYAVKTASVCASLATHTKGYVDGYQVIKMADGKCWDATDRRTSINWYDAQSVCTGNFAQPNNAVINALLSAEGDNIGPYWGLPNNTDGSYWSSDESSSSYGYYLYIYVGRLTRLADNSYKTNSYSSYRVRCYTTS